MSEDNLPDDAAAPAPEADASPEPEVTGLGAAEPKERNEATALMRKQQREAALGEPVVDQAREKNVADNKAQRLADRQDLKKETRTVTYGKGMPHVRD